MTIPSLKIQAAQKALSYVCEDMRLGLGTGSTANEFIKLLAKKVVNGLSIKAVSTSDATTKLCESLGIRLYDLNDLQRLDLVVDGADEIDEELRLIKGGGGALLKEKIVAQASDRVIIIADETKLVAKLGAFPLPIEVNRFAARVTAETCQQLFKKQGAVAKLSWRQTSGGQYFITDSGHYILDAALQTIEQPELLSESLLAIAGVVEHGLFLDIADMAIITGRKDNLKLLKKKMNNAIFTL